MSNIVFFNVRFYGHVNPTLAIVQELARRGEKVDYYCSEKFQAQIEWAGARFHPLPTSTDTKRFPSLKARMIATSLEVLPILLERLQRDPPELIMFDGVCLWGYLLSRLLRIRTVSTHSRFLLPPGCWSPLSVLLASRGNRTIPNELRRFYVERHLWSKLTQQYPVKPLKINELYHLRGDLNICFTSEAFQCRRERFDASYIFAGLSCTDITSCNDIASGSDFPLFNLKGKSVVYISLGTVPAFNSNIPFYKTCIQAFDNSNHLVVMGVGDSTNIQELGEIPPNFIVRNLVPQLEVLKHASVFINHGGTNSTVNGLTNRVPLVVFPQGADHYLVAHRVEELGAGIWLKRKIVSPTKLRLITEKVMTDPKTLHNVQQLSNSFKEAGGAKMVVDQILEMKSYAL